MYKATFTVLLAIGLMAFNKPTSHSEENTNLKTTSLIIDAAVTGINTTENTSKNNMFFDQKQQENKGNKGDKGQNGNKSHNKNQQVFGKKDNGNHNVIKHVNNKHDNGNKGHHKKKHYEKGHPNFNYVFVNKHGDYSHKNYGQWRSEQAKMKHKKYHPVYEYEAIEGFRLIKERNVFLYDETDYKINLLNTLLAQKRKANEINAVQYETYTNQIEVLQERRSGLNISINL
jgi:hypothetical protein